MFSRNPRLFIYTRQRPADLEIPLPTSPSINNYEPDLITDHLDYLKLEHIQKVHRELAQQAARDQWSHGDYLSRLIGEVLERQQRCLIDASSWRVFLS